MQHHLTASRPFPKEGFSISSRILTVNHAVEPKRCEDSLSVSSKAPLTLLCVADGCGGLGSRRYPELDGQTGAYAASRLAAQGVKRWAAGRERLPRRPEEGRELLDSLQAALEKEFQTFAEKRGLIQESGRIVGSMQRLLPTTLCAALCETGESACFCWAGDSRGYVLDSSGLHQYTRDDVKTSLDSFERLRCDAPLSRFVSADRPVRLHLRRVPLPARGLLLCMTDGVYGGLSTPMELEGLLLTSLLDARDASSWQRKLAAAIRRGAADDATLACLPLGFTGFQQLKQYFAPRLEALRREALLPLPGDGEEERRRRWARYRDAYDRTEVHENEDDWSL